MVYPVSVSISAANFAFAFFCEAVSVHEAIKSKGMIIKKLIIIIKPMFSIAFVLFLTAVFVDNTAYRKIDTPTTKVVGFLVTCQYIG